jgi:hypothetical protein
LFSYGRFRKIRSNPPVANQLFRMLPSSNMMGAEGKDDSGSRVATQVTKRVARKGACQWNHSGQHSGWPALPAEHGCLSKALQFLIANLELEFKLSPKRISKLKISNRKFMTIFQSEKWAVSEFRRSQPANSWQSSARSSQFLIATVAISEIESTRGKQTTKQNSNSNKSAFLPFCSLRDATRAKGPSDA